jgi:hypothetical protein
MLLVTVITGGVLVGANVIAIAPALVATRSKAGDLFSPLE